MIAAEDCPLEKRNQKDFGLFPSCNGG